MWQRILGHDDVADRFRATFRCGRLASTYLFVGPEGVGKRRFALALAKSLLCQRAVHDPADDPLEPCGRCESCRLFDAGNHPDLDVIGLPPEKSALSVELFIGDRDHRNQEGLCHRIALKPYLGSRKVAIIDDADHFNQESANCLLKTLEEPPPRSLVILLGTSPSKQLPTIRSRAQVVRFRPLDADVVAEILLQIGVVTDQAQAERLAAFSDGSIARAQTLADPTLWEFRAHLLEGLAAWPPDPVRLTRSVQALVDEAGKEASARRDRLRTVLGFAVELYRGVVRAGVGGKCGDDELLRSAVDRYMASRCAEMTHVGTKSLSACLDALDHIDRNANLGLVIQTWSEEVSNLAPSAV